MGERGHGYIGFYRKHISANTLEQVEIILRTENRRLSMSEGIFHEQIFGATGGIIFQAEAYDLHGEPIGLPESQGEPEEPELRCRLCECQLTEVVPVCPFCQVIAPLLRIQPEDIQQSAATLRLKETYEEFKREGK